MWLAGKHLLSRGPVSVSSQEACAAVQKFLELNKIMPPVVDPVLLTPQPPNRILWHVAAPAEHEEAFLEVNFEHMYLFAYSCPLVSQQLSYCTTTRK